MDQDLRWIQRFGSFQKALAQLREAVALAAKRPLSNLEQQGLIKAFEFTHELAWKTLKDFLESRGVTDLYGSRDTSREAFKQGLITDGQIWMEMIQSRNLTSHTYEECTAQQIAGAVITSYISAFEELLLKMQSLRPGENL